MKVLSLFDGVSGGMLALKFLGIKVDKYYASEIDERAISVSRRNFPEIEQIGDVSKVDGNDPRFANLDLLIAGSPCTNLSIAGDKKGLEGNQSKLFFEFIRILKETRPKYFLLENVASMKKDHRDLMTSIIAETMEENFPGVEWWHEAVNSAKLSVQARKRLYWTTIPFKPITHFNKRVVVDIIQEDDELPDTMRPESWQELTPSARYLSGDWNNDAGPVKVYDVGRGRQGERIYSIYGKSVTVTSGGGGPGGKTGLYLVDRDGYGPDDRDRVWKHTRRLTPIEAERLQYIPDDYTRWAEDGSEIPPSERYAMLGNGFTITVIAWLLSHLEKEYECGDFSWTGKWKKLKEMSR